ncbi:hypothetical protein GJ699_06900 [Duganella sp. FT80W]|uniref:Uncharacterized protein n=1 Tax=Duganella guangzhouensis TaxID=2666084 RepID=A0A6I2KZL3_9BURK|nr:hypothetical protein [Duganella guangzhouensis]MRW89706.1 hypothetical protein [Duganella guangzhouensis]
MQAPLLAKHDCDAGQTDTLKRVAQTQALTDNRPEAVAQRKLAEMMNNSPRALQQLALNNAIHNSPRMVAQRHDMKGLFGGEAKVQGHGAVPAVAPALNGGAVVQRVIKGLETYTDAEKIPPDWVQAYKDDIADPHSHISESDILILYQKLTGNNPPGNVKLLNTGGDHWDLRVTNEDETEYTVSTVHDGSCGVHAVDALMKISNGQISGAQNKHNADSAFVLYARNILMQHYAEDESPEEIKKTIAHVIDAKETLSYTGFGALLMGKIAATGLIDNSKQAADLDFYANQKELKAQSSSSSSNTNSNSGGTGPVFKSGVSTKNLESTTDQAGVGSTSSSSSTPLDTMRAYLNDLKDQIAELPKGADTQLLGAKIAYGFQLIGDSSTAQTVLSQFGQKNFHELKTISVNHNRIQLAVVLTHVLERIFNERHASKPFTSASQVAKTYANEISKAFSLDATSDNAPPKLGRSGQVPPTTISGVLGKGKSSAQQIYLGHNANQHGPALAHRHELIKGTSTASALDAVKSSVIGGSMTDDLRDPLNCAECIPITSARKAKLSVETDDVFPLSRHEASSYTHIKTCENCQAMYGIEDRSEREKKLADEKRQIQSAIKAKAAKAMSKVQKGTAKESKEKTIDATNFFQSDVKAIYTRLKKTIKGVAEHDIYTYLPPAKYASGWAALEPSDRENQVRQAMNSVAKSKSSKK